MSPEKNNFSETEIKYRELIVREYLRLGSVSRLLVKHPDLPYSTPSIHRVLNQHGIVRSVGRKNVPFSEIMFFFAHMAKQRIPLATLYRKMPPTFRPSVETLHRIYRHMRSDLTRTNAVALILTPEEDPREILVGEDISTPRPWLGKRFGSLSLPMGYSRKNDSPQEAVLRVLQREVFTDMAVNLTLPSAIIKNETPISEIQILDINVGVYHVSLPPDLRSFSSSILTNHRFMQADQLLKLKPGQDSVRYGVNEAVSSYLGYCFSPQESHQPARALSALNLQLADAHYR